MLFPETSKDAALLFELIFFFYALFSLAFIILIIYFIFSGNALNSPGTKNSNYRKLIVGGFIAIPVLMISFVYIILYTNRLYLVVLLLTLSAILFFSFYIRFILPNIRRGDIRIRLVMALWGAVTFIFLSLLIYVLFMGDRLNINLQKKIDVDFFLNFAGGLASIVGVVFTYIMTTEQSNRTKRQELYQTLEMQSIEMFRFEAGHRNLVEALWFPKAGNKASVDETFHYCVKQYACQLLNLFEMAVKFRGQGILPEDVFGSWIIWIWELCTAEGFQQLWADEDEDLRANYVQDLACVITSGVTIAAGSQSPQEQKRVFFEAVGNYFNCAEILQWLDRDFKLHH